MKFKDKRATVMGLGRLGGGVGVARFLAEHGASVTVTDLGAAEDLAESIAKVGGGVTYHLGGHRPEDFTDTDLLVVNPAVKPDSELIELARKNGVPISTEINIFFELCPARILGVTGSVGKTTTVSMIGHALAGPGVWVGGNIGRSLLADLDKMSAADLVVLELSSAQLYRLGPTGLAPNVSVVTNISENHLDWHDSMASYVAAKKNIITNQRPGGLAVFNYDDEVLLAWARDCGQRVLFFSTAHEPPEGAFVREKTIIARLDGKETTVLDTRKMKLPGSHNIANAAAAIAACAAVGADLRKTGAALALFEGAEHRLEFVRELKGVRYFNDSKATIPASALAALRSFNVPTVLILGGRDKGLSYDALVCEAAKTCRAVVVMGEMAGQLDALLQAHAPGMARVRVWSLEDAVDAAARLAKPGDVVLFSPAGTSLDLWKNFEQRGRAFKEAVARIE